MFEIAVRVKELASSNLNNLVERAASPAKMLRLLTTELEEAIITLERDATLAGRGAQRLLAAADGHDAAAKDWHDKAKLALASNREDLAKGALAERESALAAAAGQRQAAGDAKAEAGALTAAVADLETKLGETRLRLQAELQSTSAAAKPATATPPASTKVADRVGRMSDRIATLERRLDFAQDSVAPAAKAASLDEELAALQREAKLETELAALRKSAKKK